MINPKYTVEIGGSNFSRGPIARFETIEECRDEAEGYGTTADFARIVDTATGELVALHRRNGSEWYDADTTGAE